jgi:deoxycytidine triphosphate deaminase
MTVLSDLDVKQAIVDGHVVCRPLRPENIKGSSIDLTLGEYFWRCDARAHGVFNPYDEKEVERYFAGPFGRGVLRRGSRWLARTALSSTDFGVPCSGARQQDLPQSELREDPCA